MADFINQELIMDLDELRALPLQELSIRERRAVVMDLRRKRCKARYPDAPDTLCDLAIETVAKNFQYFLDEPINLLQYLPNSLVQKFFKIMEKRRNDFEPLVPIELQQAFVLRLLNQNVTEFDCGAFESTRFSPDKYYKILRQNCPNMSKFSYDRGGMLILDVIKWKNLVCLNIPSFDCDEKSLGLIRKHLPNIELLKFTMEAKVLTMKVVKHLAAMLNLQDLSISLASCYNKIQFDATLLAHAAGKAPRLHTMSAFEEYYGSNLCLSAQFVKKYGELYPNKKLMVPELWLTDKFDTHWPSNLSVTKLNIVGTIESEEAMKSICSINCGVENIAFDGVMPTQISQIVAALGSHLVNFKILENSSSLDEEDFLDFDLGQMLKSCPKLQSLSIECEEFCSAFITNNPDHGCTPQHFQNLKSFQLNDEDNMDDLYGMFLLGAEANLEKLHVPYGQIEVLRTFLTENPFCLCKLQELCLDFLTGHICNVDDVIEISTLMIHRSPYLKTIKIITEQLNVPLDIIEFHKCFQEFIEEVGVRFIFDNDGEIFQLAGRELPHFDYGRRPVENDYY